VNDAEPEVVVECIHRCPPPLPTPLFIVDIAS
jgi:hypothetical protein